jgi:aryl-alcohol dehydrogenase-like predicted oxidoreductase
METILIPPLSIPASRIGLGTWAIGGWRWGGSDEVESINTILAAFHLGINIIDTAPVYGFGVAEEIVGKAIKKHGHRDSVLIATKTGIEWKEGKIKRNTSAKHIRKELEASLKRLQTDYIDIYQIHWPDSHVAMDETAEEMLALFNEGKIRAIGVSNFSPAQMQAFMRTAPIHTSQPPYNLFEREIEKEILPFTEKHKIITLAYGALCRGLLTGRMRLDTLFEGDDIRKADPKFKAPHYEQYLNAVSALDQLARQEFNQTVLALCVRWILDRGHTIALWGARHPEQLQPVRDVMDWNLDAKDMHRIDAILTENIKDPIGPEFMAPP